MVIELQLSGRRLCKETDKGIHNFFFQWKLAASVQVLLPLLAVLLTLLLQWRGLGSSVCLLPLILVLTESQNHLQIDKIHLVECKILTCKCAGPPDVNFPPFHRLRGGYLNVTLSLKLMTRGRGWEVQWPGRKEGWNRYKINIYTTLLLDSLSLTSFLMHLESVRGWRFWTAAN